MTTAALLPAGALLDVTALVHLLANADRRAPPDPDLNDLTAEAFDLRLPFKDAEAAARNAGWTTGTAPNGEDVFKLGDLVSAAPFGNWVDLCRREHLDPIDRGPPVAFYAVTPEYAFELETRGELVADWIAAAITDGWRRDNDGTWFREGRNGAPMDVVRSAKQACLVDLVAPHGRRLPARVTRAFPGMIVWAAYPTDEDKPDAVPAWTPIGTYKPGDRRTWKGRVWRFTRHEPFTYGSENDTLAMAPDFSQHWKEEAA